MVYLVNSNMFSDIQKSSVRSLVAISTVPKYNTKAMMHKPENCCCGERNNYDSK